MSSWSVSEAKAKLSELLLKSRRAPQVIENRGQPVAVVVSADEFERLSEQARPEAPGAMARFLAASAQLRGAGVELEVPPRGEDLTRPLPFVADGE